MAASDRSSASREASRVTECLCAQVPMILLGKAYGQEKVNVQMLTSLGAAMHVTTARELLDTLRHVAKYPESARAMLINGKPGLACRTLTKIFRRNSRSPPCLRSNSSATFRSTPASGCATCPNAWKHGFT